MAAGAASWLERPSLPSAPTGNWSIQCAKLLGNTLKNEKVTILQAHAGLASVSQALLALKVLSVYTNFSGAGAQQQAEASGGGWGQRYVLLSLASSGVQ